MGIIIIDEKHASIIKQDDSEQVRVLPCRKVLLQASRLLPFVAFPLLHEPLQPPQFLLAQALQLDLELSRVLIAQEVLLSVHNQHHVFQAFR